MRAQQLVARGVPAGVIDDLEAVQIDEAQHVMIAAPPADRDCVADGLFEGAPVWQSGKNVVAGEVAELRRGVVDARLHLAVDLVEESAIVV